jgi:hypothetical protein
LTPIARYSGQLLEWKYFSLWRIYL